MSGAPSHRECLLPAVARALSATQVTPAKKITFLKRGDPQFAGVRLAVHQRTFKTFSALMDELSQRVPLAFGVRSVTTPRGLHGLSALEQLQDGGCYLCSDKQPPKTPGWPGSLDSEGQGEAPGTTSSWKGPKAPRRMTLVKNGDPRLRQTVVLSPRNTRNLAAFLSQASAALRFPVKQVYTVSGKKVDSLQCLLRCPSTLVCAGDEAFRPPVMEDARRNGTETLPGLSSRSKTGSWGPKAKQSVMHSRSGSGSGRPRRLSPLSETSAPHRPPASLHRAQGAPAPDRHLRDTPAAPGPLVAGDGVEKKVHLNEDGSLSVEMRVRFQLLGQDALLWSQRVGRAGALTAASREDLSLGEADPPCCTWQGHPWGFSEPGAGASGPCEAGFKCALGHGQQPGPSYEIWRNPLYASQGEQPAAEKRSGLAPRACGRRRWSRGTAGKHGRGQDSASPASSAGHSEGSEQDTCSSPRTVGGGVSSGSLHPASASPARGPGEGPQGSPSPRSKGGRLAGGGPRSCLRPETGDTDEADSDSSASAGPLERPSEQGEQLRGCQWQTGAMPSQRLLAQGGSLGAPTLSPSSLGTEDLQAEKPGQDTGHDQARGGAVTGLLLAPGHPGPGDTEGGCSPLPACASARQGRRRQRSPASAVCSPRSPGRVCCHHRDAPCLLHAPAALQAPRPPDRGGASPGGPVPPFSENVLMSRKQVSGDLRPPSPGSLYSQEPSGARSVTLTPVSNSDCASSVHPTSTPSAEPAGDIKYREHPPAPALAHTPHPCPQAGAGRQRGKTGGTPRPSPPLVLLAGQPEAGEPGAQQGHSCSPIGTPASFPEGAWACSGYCPTPPEGRPSAKKPPLSPRNTSSGDQSADDWESGGDEQGEEQLEVGPTPLLGPGSAAAGRRVRSSLSPSAGPGRALEGKAASAGQGLEGLEDDGSVTPSALPHASPDAVVREWLGNIPEEPVLMRYEMDEPTGAARDGPGGPEEAPADERPPESLGELAQGGQLLLEGDAGEHPEPEPEGALPGPRQAPPLGHAAAPAGVPDSPMGAGTREGAAGAQGRAPCALPGRVSASTQIMKALLGAKQSRPSSLPELSDVVAKRLSHSAGALVACLARLHFFDEDPGSPADKVRFIDSPRYRELLSISQALWPGCSPGRDQLDPSLGELAPHKALLVTEDFTPTSSSGVDVSSGSGGSGDGSVPCVLDGTLVPEKTELPLEIPSQGPDSSISEHPEGLGNLRQGCPTASTSSQTWACATSKPEAAEGGGGEQPLDNASEHEVEKVVRGDGGQVEEIEGTRREEPQEGTQEGGLPGEAPGHGPGVSAAGAADADLCTLEDQREHKEEAARRPVSAGLCPPDGSENPQETPCPPSEGASNASDSQGGPRSEPGVEEPPAAAGGEREQAQVRWRQGAGEAGRCTACRACLDPDPVWVSKLLKKLQASFLAHLADATAQLRARWNLQDHRLLDQMVAELEQDVSERLQASTDKELQKIQSRAGRKALGPPREALRGQASLQTEQRRRRLHGLRNLSAFPEPTCGRGLFSCSLEDASSAPGEEFCPCEACVRKKGTRKSPKDTPGAAGAPIKKAFDLQQILQKKKEGCPEGEAAEGGGVTPGQEDPAMAGDTPAASGGQGLGLGPGPGADEGDEGEGNQVLSRDKDPPGGEAEGTGDLESGDSVARGQAEQGVQEGPVQEDSGDGQDCEAAASEGGDLNPGGQGDGAKAAEVQEARGEGWPGSEGRNGTEMEGSPLGHPGESQIGEASETSTPAQEDRPASPSAPRGDSPNQRLGPPTPPPACASCSSSAAAVSSQEDPAAECPGGDRRGSDAEPQGLPCPDRKVPQMYPGSSTSEQDGPPSCPGTPEQGSGGGCDVQDEKVAGGLTSTQVGGRADGFGGDDFDF
nr:retinitis pigmentosa 1-like 1 protein [Oryctolagus cuniculus]